VINCFSFSKQAKNQTIATFHFSVCAWLLIWSNQLKSPSR